MSKEQKLKIEGDSTDANASVESQTSATVAELKESIIAQVKEEVVAELKESITEQVKKEVAAAMGTQVVEEKKPVTPFDSLTLEVEDRKFKFNYPAAGIESKKGGYQNYTAEEICDKLNADVAKNLVAMYDAEETSFITEIN